MKSNFKKLTAITLSSLGILASAPSAFCAPKACPNSAKKNNNITNAPKKRVQTESSKTKVIIPNRIISKGYLGCKFTQNYLKAPYATFIYDGAFSDQPNLEKIYLPKAVHVGSRAFENCEKLEQIVFTDQLTSLAPDAFLGCRKDLKIIYKGQTYRPSNFMEVIKPYVKVEVNYGFLQPLVFTDYGSDKINMIIQPVGEKVNDTTVAEDSDTSETIALSEIGR